MELHVLEDLDTNNIEYSQVKKDLKSQNLLESIRKAIDYSVLLNAIKDIDNIDQRWQVYSQLVQDNARELLIESFDKLDKHYNIEVDKLELYIVHYAIFKTFIGFESEHNIIEQLTKDGYTILSDDNIFTYSSKQGIINSTYKQYLDSRLGIDLRALNPKGQLIAIQVKSESYLNLSFDKLDRYNKRIKDTHHNKHQKAINSSLCHEVCFIFHKDNSTDILRLDKDNYYYDKLEQDYLIKSYLVTTLNNFGKPYLKHKDFKDRKKAY